MNLIKSEFQAWLESLPLDHRLHRYETSRCAIAEYIKSILSTKDADVMVMFSKYFVGVRSYKMPLWGRLFIQKWDGTQIPTENCLSSPLAALALLASVPE